MTTAEKNRMISAAIVARIAAGQTTREAIDGVFGPGAFAAIAGSIWETLRKAEAAGNPAA